MMIFFLPKNNKFYHCGVIYNNRVYQTFNNRRYSNSEITQVDLSSAVYITPKLKIDSKRLLTELPSGASPQQYVLRCLNLSRLSGDRPGYLKIDDVYNILKSPNNLRRVTFKRSEWSRILSNLNTKGFFYHIVYGTEFNKYTLNTTYDAAWNDLLYTLSIKTMYSDKLDDFRRLSEDEKLALKDIKILKKKNKQTGKIEQENIITPISDKFRIIKFART